MKQLLKKELGFTALPLSYLFLLFSLMTLVPGYPILMGGFFLCLGLFQSMLSAREQQDLTFTLLLPVSKAEAVAAKYLFTMLIQGSYWLLCALFTVLRMTVLSQATVYRENPMMNANPAYLGWNLLLFLLFNQLVLGGYWKDGNSLGRPFLCFGAATLVLVALGETLHHIPGLEVLNAITAAPIQWLIFGIGVCLYFPLTCLSMKNAQRHFEAVDL